MPAASRTARLARAARRAAAVALPGTLALTAAAWTMPARSASAATAAAATYVVATTGNDANPGTATAPVTVANYPASAPS